MMFGGRYRGSGGGDHHQVTFWGRVERGPYDQFECFGPVVNLIAYYK